MTTPLTKTEEFKNTFFKYIADWNELNRFKLNWWLKYPLYLLIGFPLELRNLNKMHKLTDGYNKKLSTFINART